jgi:hypothetical protein
MHPSVTRRLNSPMPSPELSNALAFPHPPDPPSLAHPPTVLVHIKTRPSRRSSTTRSPLHAAQPLAFDTTFTLDCSLNPQLQRSVLDCGGKSRDERRKTIKMAERILMNEYKSLSKEPWTNIEVSPHPVPSLWCAPTPC